MSDLETLRNIGPAFAKALSGVGITTVEQLQDLGADAAYEALLVAGHRPHFIGYYVLHMALQGRPWNDCKGKEKSDLRKRFDAIKTRAMPDASPSIETDLRRIGILPES